MIWPMIIFITIAQGIIFAAHFFIWQVAKNYFVLPPLVKIVFFVMSFSFLVINLVVNKYQSVIGDWFYTFFAVWLGLIHLLFFVSVVLLLILFIGKWFTFFITYKLVIGLLLYGLTLIIFFVALINANNPIVREQIISSNNLPATWVNKKMVWVSDIHLGSVWQQKKSDQLVNMINNLQPDIVIIGGDLFDDSRANSAEIAAPWKKLQAKQGKFFITGNHEQFGNDQSLLNIIRGLNLTVLNNEKIEIDGVTLVGVDYRSSSKESDYQKILADLALDTEAPKILWRHVPDYLNIAAPYNFILQIYGHTHVGQLWPFNYITKLVYKGFDFGNNKLGKSIIDTSSGAGTWGPPLRLGNKPEVILFKFQK